MSLDDFIINNAGKEFDVVPLANFLHDEVFFQVEHADAPLPIGQPSTGHDDMGLQMRSVVLSGDTMLLFYTSKEDSRLSGQFGGMKLGHAIEMVFNAPDAAGIVIQSTTDAWLGLNKPILEEIIGRL